MKPGKVIGTAALGFFFLLFVALDLVLFGILPLNSVMITIMPIVGLLVGGGLAAYGSKNQPAA
ncbi:MAG: hypothetical protein Q7V88_08050 [Actinomycetota bacterium]|nr:hypothetical protein [Actinomycetota bacterium]